MINHYITLIKVWLELASLPEPLIIDSVISFQKNEVHFNLNTGYSISFYNLAPTPFICINQQRVEPKKQHAQLFQIIKGSKIEAIEIAKNDRILLLRLSGEYTFMFNIFSASAGITLFEKNEPIGSIKKIHPLPIPEEIVAIHQYKELEYVYTSLAKTKIIKDNDAFMPDHSSLILNLNNFNTFWELRLTSGKTIISPVLFNGVRIENTFEKGSQVLRQWFFEQKSEDRFTSDYNRVKQNLLQQLDKLNQQLISAKKNQPQEDEIKVYEKYHHLLIQLPDQSAKASHSIEVNDIFSDPPSGILIPLDPTQTITENATRYIEKFKKQKRKIEESHQRQIKLDQEFERLKAALSELEKIDNSPDLKKFKVKHRQELEPNVKDQTTTHASYYFIKASSGNYDILIGKHAKGNDDLVKNHCKKNDLWFHARGVSGSHVVLKNPTGKPVPKPLKEEAAAYAAYNSKLKNSDWVPVSMTLAKYVRKPKGSEPGTVTLEREEVLFVKPLAPI